MGHTQKVVGELLVIAAILVLGVFVITHAYGDKGAFELRAYTPVLPSPDYTIGGGVAWQFAEVGEEWFVIGRIFPGHGLFVDVLYMDEGRVGGSISVRPMIVDNGLRVFGSAWWDDNGTPQWVGGLSQKVGEW